MQPRIVTVVLEIETNAPLRTLRDRKTWAMTTWDRTVPYTLEPRQVSVQVATPPKPRVRKKARR